MSNLPDVIPSEVGNTYGLRTWIEYSFKHGKNPEGWADFRVTGCEQIDRWWEIVCSAYLMVTLQFNGLNQSANAVQDTQQAELLEKLSQHPWWSQGNGWKLVAEQSPVNYSALHLLLLAQTLVESL